MNAVCVRLKNADGEQERRVGQFSLNSQTRPHLITIG